MTEPKIEFTNVNIQFPEFTADRSVRRKLLRKIQKAKSIEKFDNDQDFKNGINNVNLKILQGERIGLYGPNGAGKTTLLRAMTGSYKPITGRIQINGSITSLLDISIGFMDDATGYENIIIQGLQLGMKFDEIKEKISEIIEFSGLGEHVYMPVRTYSSGMRVRLAFSICTSTSPQILLLDEWLSVGDENFQVKAAQRLNQLIKDVSIVVIASHSLPLLRSIASKIIFLENGSVKHIEILENNDVT